MAKGKKPVDNTPICDRAYLRRIDPRWVPAPVPKYFWEDETHRRDYLLWLANRLGFRGMADFYRLEISKTCKRNGGSGVIKHWGTSAYAAVQDCFPEYDWKPWLFVQVSPGFWDSPANRRSYLDWLGNELGFRRPEDWYRIESAEILRRHGSSLIHSFPSLYDLMREYLPQLEWDRIDRYRPIRVEEILAWADAHRAAHRTLPTREAGEIPQSGDTWSAINRCLQYGFRGLPGGSTLIRLLKKHRGLPIGRRLPELSEEQVLAWADAYFAAQGKWPTENSGPIPGTKETWSAVAAAMRAGYRGFRTAWSLHRLLARRRGARTPKRLPPLTRRQILAWADAYFAAQGKWPMEKSGPIVGTKETWGRVAKALRGGYRGLRPGSLAQLLAQRRGRRNPRHPPPLRVEQILA